MSQGKTRQTRRKLALGQAYQQTPLVLIAKECSDRTEDNKHATSASSDGLDGHVIPQLFHTSHAHVKRRNDRVAENCRGICAKDLLHYQGAVGTEERLVQSCVRRMRQHGTRDKGIH